MVKTCRRSTEKGAARPLPLLNFGEAFPSAALPASAFTQNKDLSLRSSDKQIISVKLNENNRYIQLTEMKNKLISTDSYVNSGSSYSYFIFSITV